MRPPQPAREGCWYDELFEELTQVRFGHSHSTQCAQNVGPGHPFRAVAEVPCTERTTKALSSQRDLIGLKPAPAFGKLLDGMHHDGNIRQRVVVGVIV